jgi:hypothetical protein
MREGKLDHRMPESESATNLTEITVLVPADLAVAWQRCSWILVQEKGQDRLESMAEMVRDFLVKHGC